MGVESAADHRFCQPLVVRGGVVVPLVVRGIGCRIQSEVLSVTPERRQEVHVLECFDKPRHVDANIGGGGVLAVGPGADGPPEESFRDRESVAGDFG
ncbi:hypothetical protein AAFP30_18455 [Gordonia sp. CPCC 205515]|uniref:hypothetical protein n=1 Tax=Gordonia sp. CPCC 205515 TaxID=3140791 RepID=UPI003AF3C41E